MSSLKKTFLDILVCPIDKHAPLELIELSSADLGKVIVDGILYCDRCKRFYPIDQEIPIMLPDNLREKEKDLEFLRKWKGKIPDKVLKQANPWHL